MAAGFADRGAQILLREPELLDQALVAFRFFDGVEVLTLQVLNQRRRHGIAIGQVA